MDRAQDVSRPSAHWQPLDSKLRPSATLRRFRTTDAGRQRNVGCNVAAVSDTAQRARLASLVPMAHVADVRKSVEFYQLLGFEVKNTVENEGRLQWAWLK